MNPSLALAAAAVFAIVLLLLRTGDPEPADRAAGGPPKREEVPDALEATALAERIFSREDQEFVARLQSRRLQHLYREERRRVAVHWVRRTSEDVSGIMRKHRLSSRQSTNLNAATEAKLFWQFVEVKFFCGVLRLLVHVSGPHVLVNLAAHTGALYQRIGRSFPQTNAVGGTVS